MTRKQFNILLSLLVLASMVLAACGGAANETPEPTEEVAATNLTGEPSGTLENICGSTVWEGMTSCNDNIATIPFDEGTVLAMVYANPNPVNQNGTTKLTMDVQVTDGAGNYVASAQCYYDGALHDNPDYDGALQAITSTQQHTVSCEYKDEVVAKGTLYYWYGSNLAMTLTAKAPTSTQTFTPTASNTPTVTPTLGTVTVAPSVTDTPPTPTATREGDHCPAVLDKEYDVQFKYFPANNTVVMKMTNCRVYGVNGEKLFGTYIGKIEGRDWWQWDFPVSTVDGSVRGLQIKKAYISDYDMCHWVNTVNEFTYIQCPFERPTPTVTNTPTATATKTSTPTAISTPTFRPVSPTP